MLLGNATAKPMMTLLLKKLESEDESARLRSVNGLGELGGPEILESLKKALNDKSEAVRNAASEAIEKIKTRKGPFRAGVRFFPADRQG